MGLVETIDASLTGLVAQWNLYSTTLFTLLAVLVSYRILSSREPDIHPMLLARQSAPSTVRNEGESAVYRSQAAPHGMPLNSGLMVKDPGANKWARGRDGDLRDVWRKAATAGDNGTNGKLLTVLGSEKVIEHKLEDITRQINLVGQHIAEQGGIRVAIYLPNSIELLVTLFACSFYPNLTTVLIPFDVSGDELISMLRRSAVDTVVTQPGSFPFDNVAQAYPSLRQLIWVVDEGQRHMDWNEVPEGTGGNINVATWQDIINDAPPSSGMELPPLEPGNTPGDVVHFWQGKDGEIGEMVRFTQANLVAGIAGQLAGLPMRDRMTQADLFLPADSLVHIHTLTLTLAAIYSHASVAFNSVAANSADLVLVTQGIAPTVIVASPQILLNTHRDGLKALGSPLARASHSFSTRTLSQDGIFSPSNLLSCFSSASRPTIGTTPGKLRLLYTADRSGSGTPHLSSEVLSDLRVFTGARIVYALSAARVVGAVAQTSALDYRVGGKGHFGGPVTSVEVFLRDKKDVKTTDKKTEGEIIVRGPAVAGGEASVGMSGKIQDDYTLAYLD